MSQSKFINTTRYYIDELIKIYDNICSLKENDYSGLLLLKKDFLNFHHEVQNYKIFSRAEFEEDELNFIKSSKTEGFIKDHVFLENILMMYYFTIWIDILSRKIYKDFYHTKFIISHYKFLKRYGEQYQIISELKNGPQEEKKIFSKAELEEAIKKEKNEFIELKKKLPKEKLLLKNDRNRLEELLLPVIHEYRKFIADNFFEAKDIFRWYNKDIRVYLTESYHFFIILKAYPSDTFKFSLYPKILYMFCFDDNLEKIPEKSDSMFAFGETSSDFFLKNRFLEKIKKYYFNPCKEILDIYWINSNHKNRAILIEKIFKLIGYEINVYKKDYHYYKLEKINLTIVNSKLKKDFEKPIILAIPNKAYLSSEDAKDYIIDFKNKTKSNNFQKYIIAQVDTSVQNLFSKKNIYILNLSDILEILLEIKLFEFIKPFLIKNINKKDLKLIHQTQKNKEHGDKLKERILSFSESNWRAFEKLMEEIFEYLFKSSFKSYFAKPQLSEYEGHRRMDLVLSNVNPIHEFWINRKKEETAKRIIIDFKNYSKKITSSTIQSVTKYLHDKKGNFAIIMSKKGMDDTGIKEQRIRYYDNNQLIIVLDKNDIIEMINYKINNQNPEVILERKISLLI